MTDAPSTPRAALPAARPTRVTVLLAAAIGLAGCATGPDVRATYDRGTDFGQYRTFAFYNPLGTDRAGYQTLVSQHLKAATRRELESRGLRLDESAPQLLVNFQAALNQRVRVATYPTTTIGFGYYGYRSGLYAGFPIYNTDVYSYQEGTVNVDLVDAARKQLVWEGLVVGTVTQKDVDNLQASLEHAVALAFAKFPLPPLAVSAPAPVR